MLWWYFCARLLLTWSSFYFAIWEITSILIGTRNMTVFNRRSIHDIIATNVYTSPRVYELALPWQTSSTTPDIRRAAGWRHKFTTWLSRRTIVSPVVNVREETAGVPLFLFLLFCPSFSRRADETLRGVHSMTHSLNQGEKHISDCLYQLGICGWWLSPAESDTCKIRIVKRYN